MRMVCKICRHRRRTEIDEALLSGESFRSIATRFVASPSAIFRHGKEHVSQSLVKAKEAVEEVQAGTLFERLKGINHQTRRFCAMLGSPETILSRCRQLAGPKSNWNSRPSYSAR